MSGIKGRNRPKITVTLPEDQWLFIQSQAEERELPVSHVVSEAVLLLQSGFVYQADRGMTIKAVQKAVPGMA